MASFSTSSCTRQETEHVASKEDVQEGNQDGEKLGVGGTYAHYLTLMESFGKQQDAQARKQTVKSKAKSTPVKAAQTSPREAVQRTQEAPPERPSRPKSTKGNNWTSTHRPAAEISRKYSWQRLMLRIAERAGQLSKERIALFDTKAIEEGRKELDYNGWYIEPTKSESSVALPIPWLLDATETSSIDRINFLSEEIERFAKYVEPTPAERAARDAVIAELRAFITKNTSTNVGSNLFGSEVTGLATTTSDVDIRLEWNSGRRPDKTATLWTPISEIYEKMNDSTDYMCVIYRDTKFPIISAQHRRTGIDIQIVSAPPTKIQQALIREYLHELPHLKSVFSVARTMLGMRGLVDVFNGGIGSYGLLMMLVASLKRRGAEYPTTAGAQLLRFLDFYSDLDTEKYGVSVSPGKLFKKHNRDEYPVKAFIANALRRSDFVRGGQWAIGQRRLFQPYLLCLQDPADPTNDLGRKTNAIKHLLRTTKTLRHNLDINLRAASQGKWEGSSLLLPLVGRCHEVYLERRKRVEEYGLELLRKQKEDGLSTDHAEEARETVRGRASSPRVTPSST